MLSHHGYYAVAREINNSVLDQIYHILSGIQDWLFNAKLHGGRFDYKL